MIYNVEVKDRIISLISIKNEDGETVDSVGGNKGDEVRFTIYGDLNRNDVAIKAAFLWNGKYHLEDVIEIDSMQGRFYCYVPPISNSNNFYLGLYIGEDSDETPYLSTNKVEIPCKLSIRDYIRTPQDSYLGKYTDIVAFNAERAETAATNATNSEKEARESAKSASEDADRAEGTAQRAEEAATRAEEAAEKVEENYVNPQMYGAKGDGVTDDTQAIQAAIDSGKAVQFTYGKTYLVSSALVIRRSGVLIIGNNATIKLKDGCVCNVLEFTAWTNATIDRLTLMGNGSNLNGVYLDGTVTSLRFYQVTVSSNGENGVKASGYTWGNQFVECTFTLNGDCGFHAKGVETEGSTIGCLSTTDFQLCRFTRNTNAGAIITGSTNKFFGGWFEGNDIGLILSAETYYCGNVLLSGVDIEGNISHAVKFVSNEPYNIEQVKIIGGQVCGSTTNKSLLYYDIPVYEACSVDVDASTIQISGFVSESVNNPAYIYTNNYPKEGLGEGDKIHIYKGVNRTYLSDSPEIDRYVRGSKPSTMWTVKYKYTLEPGECVRIDFDNEVYCVNLKCTSAQPIKIGASAYVGGKYIANVFPTPVVTGNTYSWTLYYDVRSIVLVNDGTESAEIGDFLWTGKLPNN